MTECRWCGDTHLKGVCPKVKVIEFADDGVTVKRVEFMTPRDCMPANGWPPLTGVFGPAISLQPYVPPPTIPFAPITPPLGPYDPALRPFIWCNDQPQLGHVVVGQVTDRARQ